MIDFLREEKIQEDLIRGILAFREAHPLKAETADAVGGLIGKEIRGMG